MGNSETKDQLARRWLDRLAICMAAVCAVHCLLTPVLILVLPIVATSFFVHEDFHLWMIFLVLPTTGVAIFFGFRKHRDKWVAGLSALGVSILIAVLLHERGELSAQGHVAGGGESHCSACASCARDVTEEPIPMEAGVWINTLGGLLVASAHLRNFRLCRKGRCDHG